MDPIPDGSTYTSVQVASLDPAIGSNVVRMDPIPDGSTYASSAPEPAAPPPAAPPPRAQAPSLLASASARPAVRAASAPPQTTARIATAFAETPRQAAPAPSLASSRGFSLVGSAHAATVAPPAQVLRKPGQATAVVASGPWGVQVGAFASSNLARAAANEARGRLSANSARTVVEPVAQANGTLYRARVIGLSRESAQAACDKLRSAGACIIVSPGT